MKPRFLCPECRQSNYAQRLQAMMRMDARYFGPHQILIQRATVTTILGQLEREGMIKIKHHVIYIVHETLMSRVHTSAARSLA